MDSTEHNDPRLHALFEREHTRLADEPFLAATLRRIAAERTRRSVMRRVLLGLALLAVVGASPWLIAASVSMSAQLDALFTYAAQLLATPLGMVTALLCGAAVIVLNRRALF